MDIDGIKAFVLYHFPDISLLKKLFVQRKIKRFKDLMIPEEEVLLGEKNPEAKQQIVDKYVAKNTKYALKAERKIEIMFQEAPCFFGRDDLDKVRTDMHFCRFAYGFEPDEYVFFKLEGKSAEVRRTYISNLERKIAGQRMNDFSDMRVFGDKWKSYEQMKEFYCRDAVLIKNQKDFPVFSRFVNQHSRFLQKNLKESCGRGITLIDMATEENLKTLFERILSSAPVILEELVVQSPQMAVFNSSSVNTIRLVTMNTRSGIKVFPQPFFKTGRNGAFIDNAGAGGIFAGIDYETGILTTDGFDERGNVYERHPESGVQYKGYQLPEWDRVVSLCKTVAEKYPRIRYCSWDVAHTEAYGWVLIEANMCGQMVCQQTSRQRGMKDVLNEYMHQMDLIV